MRSVVRTLLAEKVAYGRGGVDAGGRHRREHGGLHGDQQHRPAAAAGDGAGAPRAAPSWRPPGGRLGLSGLAGNRRPLRSRVRRGVRVEPHLVRDRRRGREPVRRGALGQRRVLRDAGGTGFARPRLHPRGRPARVRRGWSGGRSQPPVLAGPLRWRRRRHRTPAAGQRHTLHGGRRHPAGVLRADGRPVVRRGGSARLRVAGAWPAVAARQPAVDSLAPRHAPPAS